MVELDKIPNGGLFLPAKKSSDWLLVALHGSGGSARDFAGLDEIFGLEELNYLFLNGPIRDFSNYRWYSDTISRYDAISYLKSIFDYLSKSGYLPDHIFLLGFSQGADLVFEFGVEYSHILAGYIAISGRIEDIAALLNQGRPEFIQKSDWLVTHGTKDFNLSIDIMRSQVDKLKKAGFHIDFQEYDKIHEFDAKNELPYIKEWIKKRIR